MQLTPKLKLLTVSPRNLFPASFFIISAVLFFSCSITKIKTIEPVYTLTLDSISREINSIIITPEASLTGKEIRANGQTTTELTINLINTERLPESDNEQKKIGEDIAILIKNALKNPNSFTDYKVFFTKRFVEGAMTKSSFVGYSYKSKQLKNYIQIVSVGDQFDSSTSKAIGKTIFSINEPNIVSVFSYYNNVPGSPIKFNMYKETDSASILIMSENQGQILPGNNYVGIKIKTADIYNAKRLGFGKYMLEYLVSDTVAGSKHFSLQ